MHSTNVYANNLLVTLSVHCKLVVGNIIQAETVHGWKALKVPYKHEESARGKIGKTCALHVQQILAPRAHVYISAYTWGKETAEAIDILQLPDSTHGWEVSHIKDIN